MGQPDGWDLLTEPRFVGLNNYTALFRDSLFQTSLRNTFLFVIMDAPLAVIIPLGPAMLVNEQLPGRTLFCGAFVTPLMISASSVGVSCGSGSTTRRSGSLISTRRW